jgi:hypothetical protein
MFAARINAAGAAVTYTFRATNAGTTTNGFGPAVRLAIIDCIAVFYNGWYENLRGPVN